jgi:hypothetical protein
MDIFQDASPFCAFIPVTYAAQIYLQDSSILTKLCNLYVTMQYTKQFIYLTLYRVQISPMKNLFSVILNTYFSLKATDHILNPYTKV